MDQPAPAATTTPATQADPKQTATNIAKGIQDKAAGKTGADPKAGTPPADPNAGKDKYVVDGKDVWLTPEQAKSYVQKGLAFEPKMDQLARLQQENARFIQALVENPGQILANVAKHNQIPVQSLVEKVLSSNVSDEVKESVGKWFYENAVEPLKLTPEQLKAREDAKWRADREKQDAAAKDQQLKRQEQERVEKAMGELKVFIGEAMKESGLPDNNTPLGVEMARQVADVMRLALKRKQPITPKQAIEYVKKRIKSVQQSFYSHLDDEGLANELGTELTDRLRKYFLKTAKENGGGPPIQPQAKAPARSGRPKTMSMDEFHDYLDNLKKNG